MEQKTPQLSFVYLTRLNIDESRQPLHMEVSRQAGADISSNWIKESLETDVVDRDTKIYTILLKNDKVTVAEMRKTIGVLWPKRPQVFLKNPGFFCPEINRDKR